MSAEYSITSKLSEHMAAEEYRIHTGSQLGSEDSCFVASKTRWLPPIFVLSIHLVVLEKHGAVREDMKDLFKAGFKLAKRINRVPLLRGMQFGYGIIPLIIDRNPEKALLSSVRASPITKFAVFGLPAIIDISEDHMVFFEGYQHKGGLGWPLLQDIVTEHIEPLL